MLVMWLIKKKKKKNNEKMKDTQRWNFKYDRLTKVKIHIDKLDIA